ncbi:MAG: hypothetical protein R3A45_04705 [Bdellovibrionota bacterium]
MRWSMRKYIVLVVFVVLQMGVSAQAQDAEEKNIIGKNIFTSFGITKEDLVFDNNKRGHVYYLTDHIYLIYEGMILFGGPLVNLRYDGHLYNLIHFKIDQQGRIISVEKGDTQKQTQVLSELALFEMQSLPVASAIAKELNIHPRQVSEEEKNQALIKVERLLTMETSKGARYLDYVDIDDLNDPINTLGEKQKRKLRKILKENLSASKEVLDAFIDDLHIATVAYFGEKHKEPGEKADASLFFTHVMLPVLDKLGYGALGYEGLPATPLMPSFYDFMYDNKEVQTAYRRLIEKTSKSGLSGVALIDQALAQNMKLYGFMVPLEEMQNLPEEEAQMVNTYAYETVLYHFSVNAMEYKLAMFGGAIHNNTQSSGFYDQGLFTGDKIEQYLGEKNKYLAIDIMPIEWVFTPPKKNDERHESSHIGNHMSMIGYHVEALLKLHYIRTQFEGMSRKDVENIEKPILVKLEESNPSRYLAKYIIFLPAK